MSARGVDTPPAFDAHVRVALEQLHVGSGSEYAVVSESATLKIDRQTLTLYNTLLPHDEATGSDTSSTREVLLHRALASLKLGVSDGKVMVVPKDRGACWLCEFCSAPGGSKGTSSQCISFLRSVGVSAHVDVSVIGLNQQSAGVGPSLLTEENLQRLSCSTDFLALLAATHGALQSRDARGLPQLFSNLSTSAATAMAHDDTPVASQVTCGDLLPRTPVAESSIAGAGAPALAPAQVPCGAFEVRIPSTWLFGTKLSVTRKGKLLAISVPAGKRPGDTLFVREP
uniref:Uncharacterized protein n=1 Tax=Calcidiscus leptoporus TaxID=127549 RepID=A0A7S0J9K2_9EUKA|mmetsp:Transcript_46583/g.108268  ORF Transcript_46583/g.108268 Transcript_46583/m.108268 type:complete len:285 (+) Transcript_46583:3-857(+)